MQCPNCGHTMVDGRVSLRSGYLARVVFSPEGVIDGFREKYLQGTILDAQPRSGEADVLSKFRNSLCRDSAPAARCQDCGTTVIKP